MRPDDQAKEVLLLKGKLNALSSIIRLGHDAFSKSDLHQWASHLVNNSIVAVPYSRSALIDMRWIPKVIAVSGQPLTASDSEYCQELLALAKKFRDSSKITCLDQNSSSSTGNGDKLKLPELEYFLKNSAVLYFVPICEGGSSENLPVQFIWALEFTKADQASIAPAILPLLRASYSESLYNITHRSHKSLMNRFIGPNTWLRPSRIVIISLIILVLACLIFRTRLTVSSDFELIPENEIISYSPFEGVVSKCHFKSGDEVRKGDTVLEFETEERSFNLGSALNELERSSESLELVARQSFYDKSKRGQVKLLELQFAKSQIDVEINRWYLDRSVIKAESNGILDLGPDAGKLEGKAVRPGEKLFEIMETDNFIAEVQLDERNASVICPEMKVSLYLHSAPSREVIGKVISITPKPVLSERGIFCYMIKVEIQNKDSESMICGMRGVARVSGQKVSWAYYLLRHVILWYRKL